MNISFPSSVFDKFKKMGFVGQTYGDLFNDLVDFAKEHQEEFDAFLDDRYEEDDEEGEK